MAESREYRSKATISPACNRRLRACWSLIRQGSFVLVAREPTSSRERCCLPNESRQIKFWPSEACHARPDPTKRDLDEQFSAVTIGCKKTFLFQLDDSEVKN
ncbi:uncharacterized protein LACBIDRAFT_326871 [Laccaria bicolor S238N-H82]|uniref:Predicted protein n=1 Tax=Laccaria bicolor (strain S238N-H82 / ATCC MYA-4686) TaxID=486041 RepID=B0D9Y9_LACBS|nr:uncharacterized protein LACBIDRAFT_326871 [Laccaria bicolor S238N-H82]EDR08669.1 predicted protein [Laccaria bicolor S238N-H82]|eukprot:XP_001880894.1 predicted protein [Laccaria bicolor S238N-H82]